MSPADRPRELLALAENDYQAALILARAKEPQTDAAGFHLQQTVEKALKAWLALKGIDYPMTHDLSLLLGLLEDQGEKIDPFWNLLELNSFAVQFRYELSGEEFSNFEQLAKQTKKLLAHVQSILGIEEREYTTYFKYCNDNCKVIEGIFENQKIRFSQPWVLNDPLEFIPAIKFKNNGYNYKWFRYDGVIFSSEERRIRHHLIDSKINAFGILSLTKKPDSYDMWSMYANGHKGFLIELKSGFNEHSCMKSKNGNIYPIRKVKYVDEYAINIDDLTDKDGFIQEEKCHNQMFYTKLSRWDDEEEYRIVRPLTDCEYYKSDLNRTPRTPMDMNKYLFEFSLYCVESVTFGANMCYKNKERIMKDCENTKIKFLQAIIIRDEKDDTEKTGKVELWDKNLFPRFDRMLPSNFVLDKAHINDSNEIIEINSLSELPYYKDEKEAVDKYYMEQKAKHNQKDN